MTICHTKLGQATRNTTRILHSVSLCVLRMFLSELHYPFRVSQPTILFPLVAGPFCTKSLRSWEATWRMKRFLHISSGRAFGFPSLPQLSSPFFLRFVKTERNDSAASSLASTFCVGVNKKEILHWRFLRVMPKSDLLHVGAPQLRYHTCSKARSRPTSNDR